MPFTLAHPAAVLPFLRQPFVPIALVAGAMAPDVPYFLKVPTASGSWYESLVNGGNSHDLAQILTVGFPLSLMLAAVLWLVAQPVRWAVPDAWVPAKEGIRGRRPSSARIALWTFYSLILGLVTHIVWDSFTHSYGWVVQRKVSRVNAVPMDSSPATAIPATTRAGTASTDASSARRRLAPFALPPRSGAGAAFTRFRYQSARINRPASVLPCCRMR